MTSLFSLKDISPCSISRYQSHPNFSPSHHLNSPSSFISAISTSSIAVPAAPTTFLSPIARSHHSPTVPKAPSSQQKNTSKKSDSYTSGSAKETPLFIRFPRTELHRRGDTAAFGKQKGEKPLRKKAPYNLTHITLKKLLHLVRGWPVFRGKRPHGHGPPSRPQYVSAQPGRQTLP